MAHKFTRNWWGKTFLEAIEKTTDPGRLSRGKAYSQDNRVLHFEQNGGEIQAHIRGNINHYFGVTKEPLYITNIEFARISPAKWSAAIAVMASKASIISRLMLKEIPENIEDSFQLLGLNLLPDQGDFKSDCSCPDWSNPCKHIAGVYHRLAQEIDRDPFLIFELRGLPKEKLLKELAKSPLGQALADELQSEKQPPCPVETYYQPLKTLKAENNKDVKQFWQGKKRLPQTIQQVIPSPVSGIVIKKQGDFPSFWHRDNSFIEAMETLYDQVKTKGNL